jgi:hypothetical protein
VCSSLTFNRFSGIDNGRTALMVVGLFLQGAGGLAFGIVPQFGFTAHVVLTLFLACRLLTVGPGSIMGRSVFIGHASQVV